MSTDSNIAGSAAEARGLLEATAHLLDEPRGAPLLAERLRAVAGQLVDPRTFFAVDPAAPNPGVAIVCAGPADAPPAEVRTADGAEPRPSLADTDGPIGHGRCSRCSYDIELHDRAPGRVWVTTNGGRPKCGDAVTIGAIHHRPAEGAEALCRCGKLVKLTDDLGDSPVTSWWVDEDGSTVCDRDGDHTLTHHNPLAAPPRQPDPPPVEDTLGQLVEAGLAHYQATADRFTRIDRDEYGRPVAGTCAWCASNIGRVGDPPDQPLGVWCDEHGAVACRARRQGPGLYLSHELVIPPPADAITIGVCQACQSDLWETTTDVDGMPLAVFVDALGYAACSPGKDRPQPGETRRHGAPPAEPEPDEDAQHCVCRASTAARILAWTCPEHGDVTRPLTGTRSFAAYRIPAIIAKVTEEHFPTVEEDDGRRRWVCSCGTEGQWSQPLREGYRLREFIAAHLRTEIGRALTDPAHAPTPDPEPEEPSFHHLTWNYRARSGDGDTPAARWECRCDQHGAWSRRGEDILAGMLAHLGITDEQLQTYDGHPVSLHEDIARGRPGEPDRYHARWQCEACGAHGPTDQHPLAAYAAGITHRLNHLAGTAVDDAPPF